MAEVTRDRLDEHVLPFINTGDDHFGPYEFKYPRRSLETCRFVFTCLTTRAQRIEVSHSLDTESCLAAVSSHIARRCCPNTILCDIGTNFVGAANN